MKMINSVFSMAFIDLKKIYRGTLLGWFWLFAKPATIILVYWFAFSVGLRVGSSVNGHAYFFWLVSGLIPWLYLSEVISNSPGVFRKYNYLVTKIKFPIIIVPIFTALSRLIVHTMLIILVLFLYLIGGEAMTSKIWQLIPLLLMSFSFISVVSVIFSLVGSISKDISEFIKTIVTPLLFLSPILWDINGINNNFIVYIQELNPINFIVKGYRNILIYNRPFYDDIYSLLIFVLLFILNFIIASVLFKKLKKEIPDYL